jgi:hypothetical protein
MDATSEKLLAAGEALARSIGHTLGCPKLSPALPCICESKKQQAKALDDWFHLVAEVRKS